jgi:adenylosuccinate lyase
MPHKRNPVLSENMSGLARLVRSYAMVSMENMTLWHERDISHSSAERVIGPDATILLDFMLHRFAGVVENLVVYPERMMSNLNMTGGVFFSQKVLLKLVDKGLSREKAYEIVQRSAMKSWEEKVAFRDLLLGDSETMSYLTADDIDDAFKIENFLTHQNYIFERVFGKG